MKKPNKNNPPDDILFWESGSKAFKIGLASFVSLLAVLFSIGFLTRLPYLTADDYATLAFAITFGIFGRLLFRYFLNPRIKITNGRLYVYRFWHVQTWGLTEIAAISTKKEKLRRRKGTPTIPRVIEWIVLDLKDGRTDRFIGPNFNHNSQLLSILEDRLHIEVDHDKRTHPEIPEGESPFGRRFF